jgi:ATP-dependent RNA helicase DeaD
VYFDSKDLDNIIGRKKMKTFKELGLDEKIVKSLDEMGITSPTPIQEKAISDLLKGNDIIAGSETGSGKTLTFGSGIVQNCSRKKEIQALILTPTRELCEQVMTQLQKFSKYKQLKVISVYGGVSINPQMDHLRDCDVVVATPGRLLDHIERRTINLTTTKMVVIDEADRMFDMGFIDDVNEIIEHCPNKEQTMLFSATISSEILKLSSRHLRNPIEIIEQNMLDPKQLNQEYYSVSNNKKMQLLIHLLKNETSELSMVFCNTQRTTQFVASNLSRNGINASEIHGGFTQAKRTSTMEAFHKKKFNVLVCTDVASRGLDIKNVSHVYNFDIPKEPKTYIHRIGRTARAGENGIAINLLCERDYDSFSRILNVHDLYPTSRKLPDMQYYPISKDIVKSRFNNRRPRRNNFFQDSNKNKSSNKRKFNNKKPRFKKD